MRRKTEILSCAAAALFLLTAVSVAGAASSVSAAGTADYYAPVTAESGEELLGQIHDLITTTHTHYSSYSECRDYAHTTDFAEGANRSIIEFYTHETILYYLNDISTKNDQGTWNREHVWPKSLSNSLWGTDGAGSDLHHIRPSEVTMNSQRGNDKFGESPNGSAVYSKTMDGRDSMLGGHRAGGVFEPLDNVKGDAARIVMYVYTHYNSYANVGGTTNGTGAGGYFGTLKFTNIVAAADEDAAIALLLKWNELDPVDEIETARNEAVFRIQGNRNPFIDHPGYAEAIWGGESGGEDGLEAFRAAVGDIVTEGTLAQRAASLGRAILAYRALGEDEKELAEEELAALRAAIDDYDRTVRTMNYAADAAERAALGLSAWRKDGGGTP